MTTVTLTAAEVQRDDWFRSPEEGLLKFRQVTRKLNWPQLRLTYLWVVIPDQERRHLVVLPSSAPVEIRKEAPDGQAR